MTICRNCGQCCFYIDKGVKLPCRYLAKAACEYYCRIYENRIGTVCAVIDGVDKICQFRVERKENFPGCPYNREEWK